MFCNYLAATALARRRELMFLPMRPVPFAIGHDAWYLARIWLAQFSLRRLFRGGAVCLEVGQFADAMARACPCMERGGLPKDATNMVFFLDASFKGFG